MAWRQAHADKKDGLVRVSGSTAAPSQATQAISGAGCESTLKGAGASTGQRSARICAALPTR